MRLKWVSLVFLALLLGSCASLTYNKPPWGTSNEPYAILTDVQVANRHWASDFYEVPSQNKIQLRFPIPVLEDYDRGGGYYGRVLEVYDRGGSLDDLKLALAKYSEWKDQLKDTGGKISKPINEVSAFSPTDVGNVSPPAYYSFACSFETGPDGQYALLITLMISTRRADGSYNDEKPSGVSVLLGEDQVVTLSNALSPENLLAKAREADEVANRKATEEQKNETLKQSLQ